MVLTDHPRGLNRSGFTRAVALSFRALFTSEAAFFLGHTLLGVAQIVRPKETIALI
jgi:hypothetical protein